MLEIVPYSPLFAESMYMYLLCSVVFFKLFYNEIKGLMLLSVMALTLLGAGLSMQPDAFSALHFENFMSPSAANHLSACLSLNLLNLTQSCRALKMMIGAFLDLGLTVVQGINLSK